MNHKGHKDRADGPLYLLPLCALCSLWFQHATCPCLLDEHSAPPLSVARASRPCFLVSMGGTPMPHRQSQPGMNHKGHKVRIDGPLYLLPLCALRSLWFRLAACLGGLHEACGGGWSRTVFLVYFQHMSFSRVYSALIAARLMLGPVCADEAALEERFRNPEQAGGRLSVALSLDPSRGDTVETVVRQLERIRALGAGGVLVSLPPASGDVWSLLAAVGEWCRKSRIELGLCDFWLSPEEAASTPHLQTLAWSSRTEAGAALTTNLLPWVYGPGQNYQEVARLAVPDAVPVLPHQVVDWSKGGVLSNDGAWRVFWFGRADRKPETPDSYQDKVVFRHVNQGLVELQNRLKNSYGTAFLWYQCEGPGAGEAVWPRDIDGLFLKEAGQSLTRQLPVLAGVPVGGDAAASHVKRQLASLLCEAWRERYAANVRDLVQESGLEAGIAIGEVPVEPDEVALYFRRPTLAVARDAEQRARNVRAAGAARTLARRFVVGRLSSRPAESPPDSPLLPFPFKHEMDSLLGDGATRILLELGEARLSDDPTFVQLRQACRYAQSCQMLLQFGEPVADVLVWTRRLSPVLDAYSCDYAGQRVLASSVVKGRRLVFDSERAYGVLAVSAEVLCEPLAGRLARQLAEKGVRVCVFGDGRPEGEASARKAAEGGNGLFNVLEKGAGLGIAPDFAWRSEESGLQVRFLHRRSADLEVYFVVNAGSSAGVASCTFRDTGKGVPERWDPLAGEIGTVQESRREPDGRLTAPLYLGPHDSCFVVFDR